MLKFGLIALQNFLTNQFINAVSWNKNSEKYTWGLNMSNTKLLREGWVPRKNVGIVFLNFHFQYGLSEGRRQFRGRSCRNFPVEGWWGKIDSSSWAVEQICSVWQMDYFFVSGLDWSDLIDGRGSKIGVSMTDYDRPTDYALCLWLLK